MDFNNLQEKDTILIEACIRTVLCHLLNDEETTRQDFEAILHNINVGVFGDKKYEFEDTSWPAQLKPLKEVLLKFNPNWEGLNAKESLEKEEGSGSQP